MSRVFIYSISIIIGLCFLSSCTTEKDDAAAVVKEFREAIDDREFEKAWNCLSFHYQSREFVILYNFKIWIVCLDNARRLASLTNLQFIKSEYIHEDELSIVYWVAKKQNYTIFELRLTEDGWKINNIIIEMEVVH